MKREEARRAAVLLFRPPVGGFGMLEFGSFERIVETAYDYAMAKIRGWKERDRFVDGSSGMEGDSEKSDGG